MDSLRGRIFLMKGVLERDLVLEDAAPHLDRCLGCQGCVIACPSGAAYGELITTFRGNTEATRRRPLLERIKRAGILKMLQQPRLSTVFPKFESHHHARMTKPTQHIRA